MRRRGNSYLDLTDATISAATSSDEEGGPDTTGAPEGTIGAPAIELPKQTESVSHFAIDIGGSLIKLVYFLPGGPGAEADAGDARASTGSLLERDSFYGGRLVFAKFETSRVDEAVEFIEQMGLHKASNERVRTVLKATGGGAYRFAQLFSDRLGLTLQKEDEISSLVAGTTFLLKAIQDEAFTYSNGKKEFVAAGEDGLFPYLLVNIGSGVSIVKVDADGHRRVSGTNIGGGTFWGLCRLLTGVRDFDEMLRLSEQGDNRNVDMLVGDIYGGMDYQNIGLSATTIASSFGKVVMEGKELADMNKADIALALLRMISYNIGHLGVMNAISEGVKRVYFGGFFIRGHPFTMETISFAVNFWSQGKLQAAFLRHEGFLGALGAFLSVEEATPLITPLIRSEGSWIEKFLLSSRGVKKTRRRPSVDPYDKPADDVDSEEEEEEEEEQNNALGVLHLCPRLHRFPLLADPEGYDPNTFRLSDPEERDYWLDILERHLPSLIEKAVASEGGKEDAQARGVAFGKEFKAHLARLRQDTAAYGKLGVAGLLEMREECLRAHSFADAYRSVKESENAAALDALPDLLTELDAQDAESRTQALIEGVLAGNIFDWGARACVDLYQNGTILDIYREARNKLSRPWGIDDLDAFTARSRDVAYRKALILCDNSGADVVLGVLPFARELLKRGTEVVLVANSLPALNDVTKPELKKLLERAARVCDVLKAALSPPEGCGRARLRVVGNGSGSPCIDLRRVSRRMCEEAETADLLVFEGMGRAIHTNFGARFQCDSLKLAMIKNARLAEVLFGGKLYDCVCRFEPAARPRK